MPNVIVEESFQQSSLRMLLEHILKTVLDKALEFSFKASHAIGDLFKKGHECQGKDVRAITS